MSKIQLSAEEMQLVTNSSWILTKHRIIEKVFHLFGGLSEQMQLFMLEKKDVLPLEVLQPAPKISKGEQYEALPYVVLDYPRFFSKQDVFAIRSFFWWGNYFSITLHLKGKFHQQYYQKLKKAIAEKNCRGFIFSSSGNEFSFNLDGKNYFLIKQTNAESHAEMEQQPFVKISCKISFDHWDTAEQRLMQVFQYFMALMEI